ncbi:hypothetical protein [Paenibacillus sp. MSJ-34]|uniref:hypothetical protein n=1 Tax=Paenibacillus sp. MSJ-34 TaxID=2841529 RepID=UPI001C11D725|nr:hypothetical protein [Paenibacillus sp. MSJ-34]MBU5445700.1 hypothetical protein [Paenibacillus sp. MSJ-34]
MRKSTTITQFIQEISVILDNGNSRSIEETCRHIEDKKVINWLEGEFPTQETGADFSMFQDKHRKYIHNSLEIIWGAYAGDERRKWGITNNGLCLLISWATEIIRQDFNKDDFIE